MKKLIIRVVTHAGALLVGFALGIYALPILTAPEPPSEAELALIAANAMFNGVFRRDLAGSDFLHWGEGTVTVSADAISLQGAIAPGPDYKLYLSPVFVDHENAFEQSKSSMVQVGEVKTFENFYVKISNYIDPSQYNTVVIWCETFGEFITAAQYQ